MSAPVDHLTALGLLAGLVAVASFVDLRRFIIPDWLNALLLISGVVVSPTLGVVELVSVIGGVVVGGVTMFSIQRAFRAIRGYDGLGSGDVKFVAAAGAWTGAEGIAPSLLIAASVGLLFALVSHLCASSDPLGRIAFAPALGVGTLIVVAAQTLSGSPVLDLLLVRIVAA
jgi:leader peptidase (prepilin peptidase)/N-methyltransferase